MTSSDGAVEGDEKENDHHVQQDNAHVERSLLNNLCSPSFIEAASNKQHTAWLHRHKDVASDFNTSYDLLSEEHKEINRNSTRTAILVYCKYVFSIPEDQISFN